MPGNGHSALSSLLLLFLNTSGWAARAFAFGLDRSSERLSSSAFPESAASEQGHAVCCQNPEWAQCSDLVPLAALPWAPLPELEEKM